TTSMKAKNTHMSVESPSAIESAPNSTDAASTVTTLFFSPPHTATSTPPSSIPTLNASSLTVNIHTSSPKLRTTMSGVSIDGATESTNTMPNSTSSQRTKPCVKV